MLRRIPMLSTTAALRTADSAAWKALEEYSCASFNAERVSRSFITPRTNITTAPQTAAQPIAGFIMKMMIRKIGTQGTSSMVNIPGPVRNILSVPNERSGLLFGCLPRSSASTMIEESSMGPTRRSIQPLMRTKENARTASSAA